MTPAAKSEIAIGMKTTTLNATEKRMRSRRTANTSPIAVTNAGTMRSQRKLFLIAVNERVVGEERLVVVDPDELVAVAVVEAPDDRADRRVDDPDAEQHERRGEKDDCDAVLLEEAWLVVSVEAPARGLPPSVTDSLIRRARMRLAADTPSSRRPPSAA